MKIEFRFNGEKKLVLSPQNEDEKRFLQLVFGTNQVKIESISNSDDIILTRTEGSAKEIAYESSEATIYRKTS